MFAPSEQDKGSAFVSLCECLSRNLKTAATKKLSDSILEFSALLTFFSRDVAQLELADSGTVV